MTAYGRSRSVAAAPERVWQVWSDPANWSRWNSGIKAASLDGPLVTGATGTMQTSRGSSHRVTFTSVDPPVQYTMTMAGPPLTTITFTCAVAPEAGGGSTVSQHVSVSGPLALLFGPLLGAPMARHFGPVLDDLAAAAEQPTPQSG